MLGRFGTAGQKQQTRSLEAYNVVKRAKHYGMNQKTVAKWELRRPTQEAEPTMLLIEEKEIVAFLRRRASLTFPTRTN
jgi:hypothetical protein